MDLETKIDTLAFQSQESELRMSNLAKKAEMMLNLKRMALNNQYKKDLIDQMLFDRNKDREFKKQLVDKNIEKLEIEILERRQNIRVQELEERKLELDKLKADREEAERAKNQAGIIEEPSVLFSAKTLNQDKSVNLDDPFFDTMSEFGPQEILPELETGDRFLFYYRQTYNIPENIVLCKCLVRFVDSKMQDKIPPIYQWPILSSSILSP
jgi:hypothetical protein